MKKCSKCGEEKDELKFGKNSRARDGLRYECKACHKKVCDAWRNENPEKCRKMSGDYYRRNREKIIERKRNITPEQKERNKVTNLAYRERNRDVINAKKRERHAKKSAEEKKSYNQDYYKRNREKIIQKAKEHRKKHPRPLEATQRFRRNNPEKARAYSAIGNAIRSGKLQKPDSCKKCMKKKKVEAHHHDYSKPLDVTWLCKQCHLGLHRKLREV